MNHNNETEERYIDPTTGAHFYYNDVCKMLLKLSKQKKTIIRKTVENKNSNLTNKNLKEIDQDKYLLRTQYNRKSQTTISIRNRSKESPTARMNHPIHIATKRSNNKVSNEQFSRTNKYRKNKNISKQKNPSKK